MKITYDAEADALYIRFREAEVVTEHLAEGLSADYDGAGHLAGIEILDASRAIGEASMFRQVILENLLPTGTGGAVAAD